MDKKREGQGVDSSVSRTIKYTKKQLVTSDIHRKAGPMKDKKKEVAPTLCPDCGGLPLQDEAGQEWECPTCLGEMVIYE